jgi:serine O-acetyltransferase
VQSTVCSVNALKLFLNSVRGDCVAFYGKGPSFKKIVSLYLRSLGFRAVMRYRVSRLMYQCGFRLMADILSVRTVQKTGADLPATADIGPGLLIHHPNGIVVGYRVTIGSYCVLLQGVTLGQKYARYGAADFPVVGSHVTIGAGAKVLGGVRIGDHSTVGANAVVLTDIPSYAVAVGIPAKIQVKRVDAAPMFGECLSQ